MLLFKGFPKLGVSISGNPFLSPPSTFSLFPPMQPPSPACFSAVRPPQATPPVSSSSSPSPLQSPTSHEVNRRLLMSESAPKCRENSRVFAGVVRNFFGQIDRRNHRGFEALLTLNKSIPALSHDSSRIRRISNSKF